MRWRSAWSPALRRVDRFIQGQEDLERELVRILHDNSFRDDATRIWRAVRYEQRLDFRIEPHTLDLLKRDIAYLDTISGDRIRHELGVMFGGRETGKVLLRAGELGILSWITPALKIDDTLAHKMAKAAAGCSLILLPGNYTWPFWLTG